MGSRPNPIGWVGVMIGAWWATAAVWAGDAAHWDEPLPYARAASKPDIPWEQIAPKQRASLRRVLEHPTLTVRGPLEVFRGQGAFYHWLLDHPDQGVLLWRALGARCMDIKPQNDGRWLWTDNQGTSLTWHTVYRDVDRRIWYAEGSSHASFWLPAIPARAIVILHHATARDTLGRPLIEHQADLYLQLDSRAASIIARLMGNSAPRLAEQGLGQMELFFSALVAYLERHPDLADGLTRKLNAAPRSASR